MPGVQCSGGDGLLWFAYGLMSVHVHDVHDVHAFCLDVTSHHIPSIEGLKPLHCPEGCGVLVSGLVDWWAGTGRCVGGAGARTRGLQAGSMNSI